jgi:hypothetical protein
VLNQANRIVQTGGRNGGRLAPPLILDGTCQVHLCRAREVLDRGLSVDGVAVRVEPCEALPGTLEEPIAVADPLFGVIEAASHSRAPYWKA